MSHKSSSSGKSHSSPSHCPPIQVGWDGELSDRANARPAMQPKTRTAATKIAMTVVRMLKFTEYLLDSISCKTSKEHLLNYTYSTSFLVLKQDRRLTALGVFSKHDLTSLYVIN